MSMHGILITDNIINNLSVHGILVKYMTLVKHMTHNF